MTQEKAPTPLSRVLTDLFHSRKMDEKLRLHSAFLFWDNVVGKSIADRAQPHVIKGETLWVRVCDSVWMHHLQMEKLLILEKLNARLNEKKLRDIRFMLDSDLERKMERPPPYAPRRKSGSRTLPLEMENEMALLNDDDLVMLIKSLWAKHNETARG